MGNFSNNAITDVGRMLLADVQAGAIFTPTRIVMGSGSMPAGATAQSMTAVITPVKSLAINKKKRTPDGKCVFGGVYTNEEVTAAFYFRELALYAKAVYLNEDGSVMSEGPETLYSYGNAGATADYMPAYSTSTVVEKQMDLVVWVGNDAQVDLTIESGVYITHENFDAHAARHAAGGEDPITPESIGAAPAGFGLGGPTYNIPSNGALTIKFGSSRHVALIAVQGSMYTTRAVFAVNCFGMGGDTTYVERISGKEGILYGITPAKDGNGVVIFNNTADAYVSLSILLLYGVFPTVTIGNSGVVAIPFEWADLPMEVGIEYRTTERRNGKAVYKKLGTDGVLKFRLEGDTEWSTYARETGAHQVDSAPELHVVQSTEDVDAFIEASLLDMRGNSIRHLCINDVLGKSVFFGGITHVTIYKVSNDYAAIEAFKYHNNGALKWRRSKFTTWQQWEWENPPLAAGVEYRTTERYMGAAVYKKVDAAGNILWRAEYETSWRILAAASNVAPATIE